MNRRSLTVRMLRNIYTILICKIFFRLQSWRWLAYYPAVYPNSTFLKECTESDSEVYQKWLDKHAVSQYQQWTALHEQALKLTTAPRLSIVTPVYNTDRKILEACIFSVRTQCYPYWQLLLIDDGSSSQETLATLNSPVCQDPRISIYYHQQTQGISAASNLGIQQADGDFVVFLDHDDRLSPDALMSVAQQIQQTPDVDIIYSDRDMITPQDDLCTMHLFKPGWSPEMLLSGNYIFHLLCYKKQLLEQLGGLRSEYDGSQDYDLILRASELNPNVTSIQKVLYHWRQHRHSVALNTEAKDYAFAAGLNALKDCLQRRNIKATANEIPDLWRGNYQLDMQAVAKKDIVWIRLDNELPSDDYARTVSDQIKQQLKQQPTIAIISKALKPSSEQAIEKLAAWLQLKQVALVTARIDTEQQQIHYAGMAYKKNAELITPYRDFPSSEAGYMAATRITRNISAPHPYCVCIRAELWVQLQGFDANFNGPHALLDFVLRAQAQNWRSVLISEIRFVSQQSEYLSDLGFNEHSLFQQKWQHHLRKGDPYYNSNLNENSRDMGLDV